jgi:fatty-acyl-CoA synthase
VNVYPAEIEGELLLHEDVADAAVVAVPDDTWGEVGVAFVVPRPGRRAQPDDLSRFLGTRLARYKIPKAFVLVDSLPRTPYGKVVKGLLRDQYLSARARHDGPAAEP